MGKSHYWTLDQNSNESSLFGVDYNITPHQHPTHRHRRTHTLHTYRYTHPTHTDTHTLHTDTDTLLSKNFFSYLFSIDKRFDEKKCVEVTYKSCN